MKVSVCMITYGHEKFIARAIQGVLDQVCNHSIELVISDDCSPDATNEVVSNIISSYAGPVKIKYIRHKRNMGMISNFTSTINLCSGEYIAYLEGDDYWCDETKLQQQIEFLDVNPDYVVCYHDAIAVDQYGDEIQVDFLPLKGKYREDLTATDLKKGAWMVSLTLCFRNVIREFPEEIKNVFNGDTFFASMLGNYGKGKFLSKIKHGAYRLHTGGVHTSLSSYNRILPNINTFRQLKKYYRRHGDRDISLFFEEKQYFSGYRLLSNAIEQGDRRVIWKTYWIVLNEGLALSKVSWFIGIHRLFVSAYNKKIVRI